MSRLANTILRSCDQPALPCKTGVAVVAAVGRRAPLGWVVHKRCLHASSAKAAAQPASPGRHTAAPAAHFEVLSRRRQSVSLYQTKSLNYGKSHLQHLQPLLGHRVVGVVPLQRGRNSMNNQLI